MDINTASGPVRINKRSPKGKIMMGYAASGAFTGPRTMYKGEKIAWLLAATFPSLSYYDAGRLSGILGKSQVWDEIQL